MKESEWTMRAGEEVVARRLVGRIALRVVRERFEKLWLDDCRRKVIGGGGTAGYSVEVRLLGEDGQCGQHLKLSLEEAGNLHAALGELDFSEPVVAVMRGGGEQ